VTPEIGDNYLSAEISIPRGGSMVKGCVKSRKRDADSNPIGRADANPILNTHEYIVEFEDGDEAESTANLIASAMSVVKEWSSLMIRVCGGPLTAALLTMLPE